jgi:SRSO17 transposase
MPRVKKSTEPVVENKVEEPVTETEALPAEAPKLKRTKRVKVEEVPAAPASTPIASPKSGKKENAWVTHVLETRAANDGMSYKEAMKIAKDTYKK